MPGVRSTSSPTRSHTTVRFHVRWPDGSVDHCQSPSLVVRDFLAPATPYALDDFLHRSRCALHAARRSTTSTAAARQLVAIETTAARFAAVPGATVTVEGFEHG
jgi:uncharacterized repeat protein (TIGR04042 family)